MTRIDFYILPRTGEREQTLFACKLAEKAWRQDYRIFIHTSSGAAARELDELLWTFRAGSFLPHGLAEDADPATTPILVGHDREPAEHTDLLINLAPQVPAFFSRCMRLAEIVDQEAGRLAGGRERYRFYQERGYPLHSHKL
ncbi:MAG TPA: DNA polymerase III subunit chi [Thiohalobacter sp.]|nr:DNA polymerase III subunit chi [Thiohalobacter sp.]